MATGERQTPARIWPWVLIAISPLLLYWCSVGPFVRWEESARTQKEYRTRGDLGRDIYTPLIWLQIHDPTRAFRQLTEWMVKPWKKAGFNWTMLPDR